MRYVSIGVRAFFWALVIGYGVGVASGGQSILMRGRSGQFLADRQDCLDRSRELGMTDTPRMHYLYCDYWLIPKYKRTDNTY